MADARRRHPQDPEMPADQRDRTRDQALTPQPDAGRVIADRYSILASLGRGGVGTVWRARDTLLGREVAVKEVEFPSTLSEEEQALLRARVIREARATARLNHPAAVAIFDVLQEYGRAYIVMELVDAPTLEELVHEQGPLPVERVARIAVDLLGALEAAHAQGVVHRDVKPGNVMVAEQGTAKLADFGIASVKGDPKITHTGLIMGSPAYMAPEQAKGEPAGPAADLWSLGATLYFALQGEPPFHKASAVATLTSVVYDDPKPPARAGRLAPVLMGLLRKEASRRPSAAELCSMLEETLGRTPTASAPATTEALSPHHPPVAPPLPPSPRQGTRSMDEAAFDEAPERPGPIWRSNRWLPVASVAALALLAVPAFLLWNRSSDRPQEARKRNVQPPIERTSPSPEAPVAVATAPNVAEPSPAEEGPPSPAGGWNPYDDPATGYSIAYPAGWEVVPLDRTRTDFRDPYSGTYLRVDWTDQPGPSPVAKWREYAPDFAARHEGYEEIRIEETTYKGFDAAVWEFRYVEGGAPLHAIDLGFVTGDYGFALNFQTSEEDWVSSQDLFQAFKRAFTPP